MLDWFRDPALRRRQVQAGLNKGEARNALARATLCTDWEKSGTKASENQSYRASGLTLLTAAISLEYRLYGRAVDALKRKGESTSSFCCRICRRWAGNTSIS